MGYIARLRQKLGKEQFIHPGIRVIIVNDHGDVLFIKRKDNGKIGIPAGALEKNETVEECARREVKEETGLDVQELTVIGISTDPARESTVYPNGDKIQYFTIEFYCDQWKGELVISDSDEVSCVEFMSSNFVNMLPDNEKPAFESLTYFRKQNSLMLK